MSTGPEFVPDGKPVFIAEFDDDYQVAASITSHELQRRTRCYLLLSPSLVVHPAYLWQSSLTQALFQSQLREALVPPFATFALGDSKTLQEYMTTRIENLVAASSRDLNNELRQYQSWGHRLGKQAAQIDAEFYRMRQTSFAMSRDAMFRQLIMRDLGRGDVAGISLRQHITAFGAANARASEAQRLIRSLRGFVKSAPLVSLDTIHANLTNNGAKELASLPTFANRLLTLYYRANVDDDYVVAGLPAVDPDDPTIHPYDPHIFWQSFAAIFGEKTRDFLADDTAIATQRVVLRLSKTAEWIEFANQYKDFIMRADGLLQLEAANTAAELNVSSGYMRLRVLPRVWREKKGELGVGLLGAATSALGLATLAGAPAIAAAAAIVGAVSSAVGLGYMIRPLRTFIDEWNSNSVQRIRVLLRRELRRSANR